MSSLNRAMLIGHLGRDPELHQMPNGKAVTNLSIATDESFVDKSGVKQERVEWHRVSVFGKAAEAAAKYLAKGRQVFVEGKLQTKEYEGSDRVKRYSTNIVAMRVQFLGGNGTGQPTETVADDSDVPF
jgi:single-strand DNA-binding protein